MPISKAQKQSGKARATELRQQLSRYRKSARYFVVKVALAAENTPESRKAARKLSEVHVGNKLPHPGAYWAPHGAITARG